ncbi:MAG: aminotransferase class I/II-fold pyridoxal phosphate-dependent enzyme [Spirochaetales bacterium]
MPYNFDTILDRKGTQSEKWDRFAPDVLPLWVADMDFPVPEVVIEALQERIRHPIFGYTNELSGLREAIQAWLWEKHSFQVELSDLVFLPGVVVGFNLATRILCSPSKGNFSKAVLIQPPVYPPFLKVGENAGVPLLENPLVPPSSFNPKYTLDLDQFTYCLNQKPGMFLFCSPHNPVGRVFTKQELEQIAEACLKAGTIICSDEIHADLTLPGNKHIPIASLDPEVAKKTITLMAPSKTFNIPSLEFAFAVIPDPELRSQFQTARKGLIGEVNLFGMVAARAAYQAGETSAEYKWQNQRVPI